MATQYYSAQPTSPEIIKKVEQEIVREAKNEEKALKNAVKDLNHTEKDAHKAQKSAAKAEKIFENSEKREQKTLKDVYKAENTHNIAVSNIHQAQHNVEVKKQTLEHTNEALKAKAQRVEAAMKANDEHTKERNVRLNALRGPAASTEAGMVVPQSGEQDVHNAGNTVIPPSAPSVN
ncbi:hypothetical protein D9613_005457 [Agrocybe pediades]|uniref:Uncharacterized protein n=1 Tax=Agrocybe pediades TaxID=84607 RepID=A0A8H4R042_9AGAR|nr:hypothetical protein D9613_005457 [Agrocybe pediades]